MQQNVGALIAVLLIVVLGAWLIDRLTTYSRTLACLEAGHRNCATARHPAAPALVAAGRDPLPWQEKFRALKINKMCAPALLKHSKPPV